jgi:hypothetical protein
MTDKLFTAPRSSVSAPVGALDAESMDRVDTALRRWLGP